jgi:hypothetical protein
VNAMAAWLLLAIFVLIALTIAAQRVAFGIP